MTRWSATTACVVAVCCLPACAMTHGSVLSLSGTGDGADATSGSHVPSGSDLASGSPTGSGNDAAAVRDSAFARQAASGSGSASHRDSAGASPDDFAGVCSPAITFRNDDAAGSGKLFDQQIPDPPGTLTSIGRRVCSLLYRRPQDVPMIHGVALVVANFDGVGESSNGVLRVSSRYLQTVTDQGGDVRDELEGVLYFLMTSLYQYSDENDAAPPWVVTGVGDCVRYQAGHTALARRQPGGNYTDGFQTAGFFLAWLSGRHQEFLIDLNASLSPNDGVVWTPRAFESLTGQSVDALWVTYQASL